MLSKITSDFSMVCGVLLFATTSMLLSGCDGGGEIATARVTGTIKTESGEPLPSGIISFRPQQVNAEGNSGKSAFGEIKDGEFTLTTYRSGDGAVVGTHKVFLSESPRPDEDFIDKNTVLPEKHGCDIGSDFKELEVKSGSNTFDIVAVRSKRIDNDDDDD